MKLHHSWTMPRRSIWRAVGQPELQQARRSYCANCGGVTFKEIVHQARYKRFPATMFRAYGDIARKVNRMPPCKGLPASYDAPIGA
jgi:hypothetical protein